MKYLILFLILTSCISSNGIHNDSLKQEHRNMIKQNTMMRKKVMKSRRGNKSFVKKVLLIISKRSVLK